MRNKNVDTDEDRRKQLQSWAEATELEIREITAAMAPLQQQLHAARERLDLIQRLMRLGNNATSEPPKVGHAPGQGVASRLSRVVAHSQPGTEVEDHLEAILQDSGQPMHIRGLRQALIERGVPLPGRGDEANIILRLGRANDRFVRTGRGTYGLSKWGIEPVPPAQRKKRVHRRRKAT